MNTDKLFESIALSCLGIETLAARKSDSADFHEMSVWDLKAALKAAYEAGQREGREEAKQAK